MSICSTNLDVKDVTIILFPYKRKRHKEAWREIKFIKCCYSFLNNSRGVILHFLKLFTSHSIL